MTILAILSLLIWAGLVLFWHQFWRADQRLALEAERTPRLTRWPSVAVIVPARNEAITIETCLESLAAQDYPGRFRILLSNDSSTDDTAEIAGALVKKLPSGLLEVIDSDPLPEGWAGKVWALAEGVRIASPGSPDFYWLSDADIRHAPQTLRQLVEMAEGNRLALVSTMVRLSCRTFWEKLLIPPFIFFFGLLYPFRAVNDPHSPIAGAAGGSILIRRDALDAVGGYSAIHEAIIDDCALARAIKRTGRRIWLGLAEHSHSLRDYPELADIWDMVTRSAYHQLRYSPALLVLTLLGLALTFLVPPLATLAFAVVGVTAALAGLIAWILMIVAFSPTIRYHGLAAPWALTLPAAALLNGVMTASSALDYYSGRKHKWRGREVVMEELSENQW